VLTLRRYELVVSDAPFRRANGCGDGSAEKGNAAYLIACEALRAPEVASTP
jgi:hypothetical protein